MEQVKDIAEYGFMILPIFWQRADLINSIPQEFVKDGMLFMHRCTKPDKREFISQFPTPMWSPSTEPNSSTEISQAVGVGFLIMGVIGYVVKLGADGNPLYFTTH